MKLESAEMLSSEIVKVIQPQCNKIMVAGSIRRQRPMPHDIDIVLDPCAWEWNAIIKKLKFHFGARVLQSGPKLTRMNIPTVLQSPGRMQVDIYKATFDTWGVILLIRTGSVEHNIKLCSRAQRMGMKLSAKGGVIKDGKVIASRTEADIFRALKVEYVEPEKREVEGYG